MKLTRSRIRVSANLALFVMIYAGVQVSAIAQQAAAGRAATAAVSTARAKEPKTVTDFYLALPNKISAIAGSEHFEGEYFAHGFAFDSDAEKLSGAALAKHRRSQIKTEDTANGYLRIEGRWEGWIEIAIFRKADNNYIVAVSEVGCGPGCQGNLVFLSYSKGRWTNVTEQVFPADPFSFDGYFALPRTGTTIKLLCGGDNEGLELEQGECRGESVLGTFKWDRTKFTK
jgi:hypothetical protein